MICYLEAKSYYLFCYNNKSKINEIESHDHYFDYACKNHDYVDEFHTH